MHINKSYILSGQHVAGFYNVAAMLSTTLHREVKNSNPNAYAFYRRKKVSQATSESLKLCLFIICSVSKKLLPYHRTFTNSHSRSESR
ncbi:MAG TPA: hypothetical protein VEY10_01240 [Flavisolibacter sp.]|nr:hypothetical protein [Flavisolibacter sp.]